MYCPHCGHLNADGAIYCINCGTRLIGGDPQNPSASNPDATAQMPRVQIDERPQASSDKTETSRRHQGRSKERNDANLASSRRGQRSTADAAATSAANAASVGNAAAPAAAPAVESGSDDTQALRPSAAQEPAATSRAAVASELTERLAADRTRVAASQATVSASRAKPLNRDGSTETEQTRRTSPSETDRTRVVTASNARAFDPGDQPRPAPAADAVQPQQATRGSATGATTATNRHRMPNAAIAGIATAVVAVLVIALGVGGVFPSATSTGSDQSAAATSADEQTDGSSSESQDGGTGSYTFGTTSSHNSDSTSSSSDASDSSESAAGTSGSGTASSASGSTTDSSQTSASDSSQSDVTLSGGTASSKTYGYSVSMPSQFTQQSGDGSGATYYDATNGITISLWGDTNPSGTTAEAAYHSAQSSASSGDYVAHGHNWVVYSTESDNGIVYDMTYYESGKTCHMHISYPMSSKSAGDAVVNQIQPTFKLNS